VWRWSGPIRAAPARRRRAAAGPAARPERPAAAARGALITALRHALSGGQAWVPVADFAQTVAAPLRATAGRRWPGGLAVGDPDLPNRNPLQGMNAWPADDAARISRSHVPARFKPLLPRPPRDTWQAGAPQALT